MTIHDHDGIFGIGAQVYVQSPSDDDPSPWPDEPSGIIVGAGGSAINRVTNAGGPTRMWVVQFDSPQKHLDGTYDHPGAHVHEKYLHLAPAFEAPESWSAGSATVDE
jgi:hypothetical protein